MDGEVFSASEVKIIVLSLQGTIEDLESVSKDETQPFTPESRKDMRDMLVAAKKAKRRFERMVNSGMEFEFRPWKEGDEKQFYTKES